MTRRRRLDLLRPSARALREEGKRTPGYSRFDWLHGYVYGRWPYLYIGVGTREHWLARLVVPLVGLLGRFLQPRPDSGPGNGSGSTDFADSYHGKVVPPDAAAQLVTVQEAIDLGDLEHIIPYAQARDMVLQDPDHIVVLECPCRTVRPDPCLPLDVCLVIGEPFASFVAEHHPRRARWITQDEAVGILHAEHERGHVHHAFFKDAMLGRFYAICNCCSCCCGAMDAWSNGTPMLASSGFVAREDSGLCSGCGVCADTCPFGAIALDNGHAVVDAETCMGCGVCVSRCPEQALELVREPSKGEPLEIQKLIAEAALESTGRCDLDVTARV